MTEVSSWIRLRGHIWRSIWVLTFGVQILEQRNAGDHGSFCHQSRLHNGEDAACGLAVTDVGLNLFFPMILSKYSVYKTG